jgi:hypothetical protein
MIRSLSQGHRSRGTQLGNLTDAEHCGRRRQRGPGQSNVGVDGDRTLVRGYAHAPRVERIAKGLVRVGDPHGIWIELGLSTPAKVDPEPRHWSRPHQRDLNGTMLGGKAKWPGLTALHPELIDKRLVIQVGVVASKPLELRTKLYQPIPQTPPRAKVARYDWRCGSTAQKQRTNNRSSSARSLPLRPLPSPRSDDCSANDEYKHCKGSKANAEHSEVVC